MKPLFSPRCDLVGWIVPGRAIFDTEMNYVAYVGDEQAWCAVHDIWLGSVDVVTVRDRFGLPVAWNPERDPAGGGGFSPMRRPMRPQTPMRPKRPLPPIRPLFPRQPLSGWSQFAFVEWRRGGVVEEPEPTEPAADAPKTDSLSPPEPAKSPPHTPE